MQLHAISLSETEIPLFKSVVQMSSGTSSELSSMESVSQLVLTIECLEGNPHLLPVVNSNGKLIKLFPSKLYCDIQKKFTWGVIIIWQSKHTFDICLYSCILRYEFCSECQCKVKIKVMSGKSVSSLQRVIWKSTWTKTIDIHATCISTAVKHHSSDILSGDMIDSSITWTRISALNLML